jgi:hypothetical protein
MTREWVIGAQLSTSHAKVESSAVESAFSAIARIQTSVKLDILIIGAREVPELFATLTDPRGKPAREIYLWYNLLSDIPGMETDDLVVDWRGGRSQGWGGWSEQNPDVQETFRFACPNNPAVVRKTLAAMTTILDRYPFDGVFLDKMRYPSPANGADELVSCFCTHCRQAAAKEGLDLESVIRVIHSRRVADQLQRTGGGDARRSWVDELLAGDSILRRFLRFRSDSVTRIVAQAAQEARERGRKIGLDLFSPGLAAVVGQDYSTLASLASWVKPMTYRMAQGPASLRLEIPALADHLETLFHVNAVQIAEWCSKHVPGFKLGTLDAIRRAPVPFDILRGEISTAVRSMASVPVYFGLELIHYPGSIEIKPRDVVGVVNAGREAGAGGAMISWDLMYAPADGIKALGEQL